MIATKEETEMHNINAGTVPSRGLQDVIKEAELKAFLDITRLLQAAAYGFRKRIANGATIEPSESYSIECDVYDADEIANSLAAPVSGTYAYGVDISSNVGEQLPNYKRAGHYLTFLGRVMQVHDNNGGCTSPVESFIVDLLHAYSAGVSITPDYVLDELKPFQENFSDAVEDARRMIAQYPQLFNSELGTPES